MNPPTTRTASSGAAAPTRLSTSLRPVWVAKPYLLDNYGLTGPTALTDYGNVAVQALTVQAPTHPMAAGRTGTLTAFTVRQTIGWGAPAAAATTVTTALVGTTARAAACSAAAFSAGRAAFAPATFTAVGGGGGEKLDFGKRQRGHHQRGHQPPAPGPTGPGFVVVLMVFRCGLGNRGAG